MIELACSTVSLPDGPLDDVLATVAAIGFQRVELVALGQRGPDLQKTSAADLGSAFERAGLDLIALYPKPIDTRDRHRLEASLPYVQQAIDTAAELGCERVVFSPLHPGVREDEQYVLLAEGCRRLADYIDGRPVTLCLENHHGWLLSGADDFARVMADVVDSRIAITMDTGHFTATGVDQIAFVDRFADRIHHLHLKDQDGERPTPFGEGSTPNTAVLDRLARQGFSGYASLELELGEVADPSAALAAARAAALELEGLDD